MTEDKGKMESGSTFEHDLNFLKEKDPNIIVLKNSTQQQIITSAKYQGKIFTSTCHGIYGKSIGWVNYKAFEVDHLDDHFNAYGGEDRMWIGPEGGLYSIFIKPNMEQTFSNWHTPKSLDTEVWEIVDSPNETEVKFEKEMFFENYLAHSIHLKATRKIKLLDRDTISSVLNFKLDDRISTVAYTTENTITNKNNFKWTKDTGTVCIWMLDMYPTSSEAFTIIPYNKNNNEISESDVVKSDYFGEVPETRLKVDNGVILFRTDGHYRSKLGLNALRTLGIVGNYDIIEKRLTITTFDVCKNEDYLNQSWDATANPLKGSVLNAYNDGPLDSGDQMGPFLELESSSPAAFLAPDQSLTHCHHVFHFMGDEALLDLIIQNLLKTSISDIKNFSSQ